MSKVGQRFASTRAIEDSVRHLASSTSINNGTAKRAQMSPRIPIDVGGNTVDFSAVLLRDSCTCPSCVHESTGQRMFSTADIPADIEAQAVEIDDLSDSVSIKWKTDIPGYTSDHSTKLSMDSLRHFIRSGSQKGARDSVPKQDLWPLGAPKLPDHEYNTYMRDDAVLYEVIRQLRVHGLAFVTNVPDSEESLATIATRIGPIKDTFYGYTWDGMFSSSLSHYDLV